MISPQSMLSPTSPVTNQPGTPNQERISQYQPIKQYTTSPMQQPAPAYSPAYSQQSGPFQGGRKSPHGQLFQQSSSPSMNRSPVDYVTSAAMRSNGSADGAVDIDEALGHPNDESGVVD